MTDNNPYDLVPGDVIRPTGTGWAATMRGRNHKVLALNHDGYAVFEDLNHPEDIHAGWIVLEGNDPRWDVAVVLRADREDDFPWETPQGEQPPLEPDMVNHPSHYKAPNGLEVSDFLDAFVGDDPQRWNAGKYIMRAGKKDPAKFIEDLEKAVWYLNRRIAIAKAAQ